MHLLNLLLIIDILVAEILHSKHIQSLLLQIINIWFEFHLFLLFLKLFDFGFINTHTNLFLHFVREIHHFHSLLLSPFFFLFQFILIQLLFIIQIMIGSIDLRILPLTLFILNSV